MDTEAQATGSTVIGIVSGFIILSGIVFGIIGLCGIPKYGKRGLLSKSIIGIAIPIILILLAIPVILNAIELSNKNG